MANIVMFAILAVVILGSAVMCVTTKRIMRAATFMLFVLFGVAGLYFLLDYTYLGAAQISVYAGGVTMIYVFAIQLVSKRTLQGMVENIKCSRAIGMSTIGHALVGSEKYQYVLPFEFISIFLLACIIGALVVSRKVKED